MSIRNIIYLPDPRLRKISAKIKNFDDKLQVLIADMFDTMYDAHGVGLAAPQIGINLCLSVVDIVGDKAQQLVLVNPEIIGSEGLVEYSEGCLSVPGAYDKVWRYEKVTVRAQDRFGKEFEINADGLLSECLQHEIDHLHGKLFIDLLTPMQRAHARKKVDKFRRQNLRKS